MKTEDAVAGLMYLTATTPGPWDRDVVLAYTEQCERFPDPQAFVEAMKQLALRWTKPSRPLPYDITMAYNARKSERDLDERYALTEGYDNTVYPTFEQGVQIAWEAYQDECKRVGKEPDRSYFDKWLPVP